MTERADQPPVVDIHTHVFNARYLPLRSIFLSFVDDPSWVTRKLASAVAKLIEESTGTSYGSRFALASTRPLRAQLAEEIGGRIGAEFEARVQGTHTAARSARAPDEIRYVEDRLADDPVVQALVEVEQVMAASRADAAYRQMVASPELDAATTRQATVELARTMAMGVGDVLDGIIERLKKAILWGLEELWSLFDKAMAWWDTIEEFLTFVFRALMAELEILAGLRDAYAVPDVTFVHLMMDMELAYNPPTPPRYRFEEQVRRMRRLAADANGDLVGFTAFDPRRSGDFSLPEGFAGVKFYPAMGYRPYGNTDSGLQTAVDRFFTACARSDVPVFTHCTPKGFQASKGSGLNAHPKYWADALCKHSALRLCLGHAGGGRMSNGNLTSHGWLARNESEWNDPDNFGARVADLCKRYQHVYCEFGHLDAVLHGGTPERTAFERNFVRE